MMFHVQGPPKNQCKLLAVLSGSTVDSKPNQQQLVSEKSRHHFPELVSSGRLEVQILINPTTQEFQQAHELSQPNIVYLQGEQLQDCEDIGSLVLGDVSVTSEDELCGLFGSALPTTIYLEIPNGEKLAEALRSKGTPYVIYWEKTFSLYAACHFRQSLFSVVQSSCTHTWDAFQLAHASFRFYCLRNNNASPTKSGREMDKLGPCLLGDPPKIDVGLPEADPGDEEESLETLPAIKIYDDDVSMRFLICGGPCTLDACLLGSLEDGLNALLSIEIRGSKLHNRASAPPPPLQAGTFSRSVVTMRCDLSTCSSAHISLLVSGNAQTCFNDDILENHIKNELIEKGKLVQASCERKMPTSEPRKSASVACGASVFEVSFKVPAWSSQVLRQLAPDLSYRSLVALGIASIQGLPVASFEKDDADRLLFFCKSKELCQRDSVLTRPPSWLVPPVPRRKRDNESRQETLPPIISDLKDENGCFLRPKFKIAAMRPIPRIPNQNLVPFSGVAEAYRHDIDQPKRNTGCGIVGSAPAKRAIVSPTPVTHRKSMSSSYQSQQIISLNPLPLKKHGCGRSPILDCSEEEFLRDVMQFLILRGHNRLIPQGGLAEFPEAVLNATRLDLYSLYREVVSRGGFHVGNGINWKGQVFSKMRNFTLTHRMTGVGNTLKRHYETYLLEYELAHDDVDGECCLVCHSSVGGDWVNCGACGEWAHFGCDRRQGLGAFKDYAKTDGLEYMCPLCSVTNFKQKTQKITNGY